MKDFVHIEKSVRIFGISTSTFYIWGSDLPHSCSESFFKKCNRIYSNQITPYEINAVKKCLFDPATVVRPRPPVIDIIASTNLEILVQKLVIHRESDFNKSSSNYNCY
ncbi:MAG: hypothetical protein COA38_19000 [Fluviicola sp.]|nr:MAG: hypothetical protein COA38_19000 [Fluviicola sp.]